MESYENFVISAISCVKFKASKESVWGLGGGGGHSRERPPFSAL